jgi:hypothetical protein
MSTNVNRSTSSGQQPSFEQQLCSSIACQTTPTATRSNDNIDRPNDSQLGSRPNSPASSILIISERGSPHSVPCSADDRSDSFPRTIPQPESPMDQSPDGDLSQRPASARAWADLYATERGHSKWFNAYSRTDYPIIISDCGIGTNPYGYTYADFLDCEDEEARLLIIRTINQGDPADNKNQYPFATIFVDDTPKRYHIKRRIRQVFNNFWKPLIIFVGDNEEVWNPNNDDDIILEHEDMSPHCQSSKRSRFDNWTAANMPPIDIEELKQALVYAKRHYATDDEQIKRIHAILCFISSYACCETMRDVVRRRLADSTLVNTFETLVNMSRAQLKFEDRHSQYAFIALMADQIVRLIYFKFEHYIPEAVRLATSGIKRDNQDLTWKGSRHVGIMFPHEDFPYVDTNSALVRLLRQSYMDFNKQGNLDFEAIQKMKRTCEILLNWNDWTSCLPENEAYVRDVIALSVKGKDIFGIDTPKSRTPHQVLHGDHKRDIKYQGATYNIRHCNNLNGQLGNATSLKQMCLICGSLSHFTSNHQSCVLQHTLNDAKAIYFDNETRENKRLDSILQEGSRYSLNKTGKPTDSKSYARTLKAQHKCASNHACVTCRRRPGFPHFKTMSEIILDEKSRFRKKGIPLSRITAEAGRRYRLDEENAEASSSRHTLDKEEEETLPLPTPPRRPRYSGRGRKNHK